MPLRVDLRLEVDWPPTDIPTLLDLDLLPPCLAALALALALALAEARLTAPKTFALRGGLTLLSRGMLAASWMRAGRQLGRWLVMTLTLAHCCNWKLRELGVGATHRQRKTVRVRSGTDGTRSRGAQLRAWSAKHLREDPTDVGT
jgi:hypothetical protein